MSKMNGSLTLLKTHLYLVSLGIPIQQVVSYMKSPLVEYISKSLKSNTFIDPIFKTVENTLKGVPKDIASEKEVNQFASIYSGALEFSQLASILKVNQKLTANLTELDSFFRNIEKTIFNRENYIFKTVIPNLQSFNTPLYDSLTREQKNIVKKIAENNGNFHDFINGEKIIKNEYNNYITSILFKANELKISGGRFNVDQFFFGDAKTKEVIIDYYNLIKDSINIFHVIDDVPHFKAMIEGVSITHEMLNAISPKYKFIFKDVKDLIYRKSKIISSRNSDAVKTIKNNKNLPIDLSDFTINRLVTLYDKTTVAK
jgi:hypothetical protein